MEEEVVRSESVEVQFNLLTNPFPTPAPTENQRK